MKYEKFIKLFDKVNDKDIVNKFIEENKTDNQLSINATEKFKELLDRNIDVIDELHRLECGMIQLSFLEKFKEDPDRLEFFKVRDKYLYARVPFYILHKTRKDIRVYVGKLDDITLINDRPIGLDLEKVHKMVLKEMMNEISYNLQSITNEE